MKGKITQWNDDKGFGFITPDDKSAKIFFHISVVNPRNQRPQIDDAVLFEATLDNQQRMRATEVYYEGLTLRPIKSISKQNNHTHRQSNDKKIILEPVKKTSLDHVFLVIAIGLIATAGYSYFNSKDLTLSIPFALPAIVLFAIYNRQKTPTSKLFTCARCRCNVPFDNRTIRAWNMGTLKLYCSNCHTEWLRNREITADASYSSSSRSVGCLGALAMMVAIPVSLFTIAHWLS